MGWMWVHCVSMGDAGVTPITVLFVPPGRMARVAPVIRQVMFARVTLPCPRLGPTSQSTVLLFVSLGG